MDVLEYTAQRFILVHKRSLPIMLGMTMLGAGIVMISFMVINRAYPWFGLPLVLGGLVILFTTAPQSYITFDKTVGKMEIQRRWVYFKKIIIQHPLGEISDVRTVLDEKDKQKFRVEVKAGQQWLPFTESWIRDSYNRENLEAKVRAFLGLV
ncbi:MAG: hypothetical protein R3B47_10690 [Bacteroidia bacterium]